MHAHLLPYALSSVRRGNPQLVDAPNAYRGGGLFSSTRDKYTYFSTDGESRYGTTIFRHLDSVLGGIWRRIPQERAADITNSNRGNIGWYIDGSENFTIKNNLGRGASSFSIPEVEYADARDRTRRKLAVKFGKYFTGHPPRMAWILKPAHPHVGRGDLIKIFYNIDDAMDLRNRPRQIGKVRLDPMKDWIVQPLVTNLVLWPLPSALTSRGGSNALEGRGKKFDCRFYAVVFRAPNGNFFARTLDYGIARISVARHYPFLDPLSAITNIGIQSGLDAYSESDNMPLIYDDEGVVKSIVQDFLERTSLTLDTRKLAQILILGLDIMFLGRGGAPILIEVNTDAYFEFNKSNAEQICSKMFVRGVFGHALPAFLRGASSLPPIRGWQHINLPTYGTLCPRA